MVYKISTLGFSVKSESPKVLLLLPIPVIVVYLIGCASLWSFTQLFGMTDFTWVNGAYAGFLLAIARAVFSKGDVVQ